MSYPANIQTLLQDVTAPVGEAVDVLLRDLTPHLLTLRFPRSVDDLKATRDTVRNALTAAIVELDRLDVIYSHTDELAALVAQLQPDPDRAPETTTEPAEA